MNSIERSILNTVISMTHAFDRGDIEGVMASYEDGATVVFEPGSPVTGAAAIRQKFAELFTMKPKFEYSGHEVIVAGDVATHTAPWTMNATAPDGSSVVQHGLSVATLRRQKNDEWLMVLDNPQGQALLDEHGYP